MPKKILEFKIEEITPSNKQKWESYFKKEFKLYHKLEKIDITKLLFKYIQKELTDKETTEILSLLETDPTYKKTLDLIKEVFGENSIEKENFHKTLSILKHFSFIGDRSIYIFQDPVNSSYICIKNELPPNGLYVAYISLEGEIIISVMVVPTPDKAVQTHKFIFRSLAFLIKKYKNNTIPTFGPLSMALHSFAAKAIESKSVISRPLRNMENTLKSNGFKKLNETLAEKKLGKLNYDYSNKWGMAICCEMVYHENDEKLQEIHTQFKLPPDADKLFELKFCYPDSNLSTTNSPKLKIN